MNKRLMILLATGMLVAPGGAIAEPLESAEAAARRDAVRYASAQPAPATDKEQLRDAPNAEIEQEKQLKKAGVFHRNRSFSDREIIIGVVIIVLILVLI